MTLRTPVALLVYNRPHLAARVLERVRAARPPLLLVVADGPRTEADRARCEETRALVAGVDWECEVRTDYAGTNLGCRARVASGLDWVFSQVEEAIVLEDDCVPDPSFFGFCDAVLERYRDDERVMHVGGINHQGGTERTPYDYFFSKYNHVWGWASWRRAWKHYDLEMHSWPEVRCSGWLDGTYDSPYEREYWTSVFEQMHRGELTTWDYAWTYACWTQGGLSVYPRVNLVSNVGSGADATHTAGDVALTDRPTGRVGPEIAHPPFVMRHRAADEHTFDHFFPGRFMKAQDTPLGRVRARARTLRSRLGGG